MYMPNLEAKINETVVLPIKSDPTSIDGDLDGLDDSYDTYPLVFDSVIDSDTADALNNFIYDYLELIAPPAYKDNGEKITNKDVRCSEAISYFDRIIWPYLRKIKIERYNYAPEYEYIVDQTYMSAYYSWFDSIYGATGLEKFWQTTSDATTALYYELTDLETTFESAKEQIIKGNYSDKVTIIGTAGQILLSICNVDLFADIRDVTYDVTHWEMTWHHVGQTALDAVGLMPLIGIIKNADEIKNIDELITVTKNLDSFTDVIKTSPDAANQIKSILTNASEATKLIIVDNIEIWAKLSTHTGNNNIVVLGKYNYNGVSYDEVAKGLGATYYSNPWWDELEAICSQQGKADAMWAINESFLKAQTDAGKVIVFSHNPTIAKTTTGWDTTSFGKELKYGTSKNPCTKEKKSGIIEI